MECWVPLEYWVYVSHFSAANTWLPVPGSWPDGARVALLVLPNIWWTFGKKFARSACSIVVTTCANSLLFTCFSVESFLSVGPDVKVKRGPVSTNQATKWHCPCSEPKLGLALLAGLSAFTSLSLDFLCLHLIVILLSLAKIAADKGDMTQWIIQSLPLLF